MKLTQKTFTTKDTGGCEFECHLQRSTYYASGGKKVDERKYSAMGLTSDSLKGIQQKVAETVWEGSEAE